eukprot:4244370-Amphidinium_carterae.1
MDEGSMKAWQRRGNLEPSGRLLLCGIVGIKSLKRSVSLATGFEPSDNVAMQCILTLFAFVLAIDR